MQQRLFTLYRFYHNGVGSDSTWMPETFKQDLFDNELLRHYGIHTDASATAGTLISLDLDTVTLDNSLGLGMATGGLLGGILLNTQDVADGVNGQRTLHTGPETLTLLTVHALDLLHVLQTCGHATQSHIELNEHKAPWNAIELPNEPNKARSNRKWSSLNTHQPELSRSERAIYIDSLSEKLKV